MRAHTSLSSMHSDSSLGSCPTQFADSVGSATTLHLDFARLKSEHWKLKKYFEVVFI
jgi:hypothetical protein